MIKTVIRGSILCIVMLVLNGCLPSSPTQFDQQHFVPAKVKTSSLPVKIVKEYVPVPMPGQMMTIQTTKTKGKTKKHFNIKQTAVNYANKKSTYYPKDSAFINSMMTYPYMEGALYTIYSAPLKLTDIQLEPGEEIISIAAGDTSRWIIGKTHSGEAKHLAWHLLIKPIETDIETSLDIMTNQRSYHLKLIATGNTYLASVKWNYPSAMITENRSPVGSDTNGNKTSGPLSIDMNKIDLNYHLELVKGATPAWYPTSVFNDGTHTYIQFPNSIHTNTMPILMVAINPTRGDQRYSNPGFSPMVNYRIKGNYMIVDTVIKSAILQTGVNPDDDNTDRKTQVWIYH